jgi:hypothetical protein
MTIDNDPEQQQAELLWKYLDELKQAENPDEVQFVAVTRGECAEVVGLLETAAEAYVLARAESAPHCRREAVRRRLHAAMGAAAPTPAPQAAPRRSVRLPAWLTAPLTGRATGWAVAAAALVALLWFVAPRPPTVPPMSCAEAVQTIPKLVDDTLDAETSRALWAHLIECKGCMRFYEKAKAAYLHAHPSRQSRLPGDSASDATSWRSRKPPENHSFRMARFVPSWRGRSVPQPVSRSVPKREG